MTEQRIRRRIHDDDRTVVVCVSGEVDMSTAPALEASLDEEADVDLVIDLTDVTYLDSSGIRVIARTLSKANGGSRRVRLVAPPGSRAAWTFRVAGFGSEAVVSSLPEALGEG